jgi:hypothetical protein
MPEDALQEVMEFLRRRREAQKTWIEDETPYIVADQRHLDANTPERAYWHFGYFTALTDVLALLERGPSRRPGSADTSSPNRLGGQDG